MFPRTRTSRWSWRLNRRFIEWHATLSRTAASVCSSAISSLHLPDRRHRLVRGLGEENVGVCHLGDYGDCPFVHVKCSLQFICSKFAKFETSPCVLPSCEFALAIMGGISLSRGWISNRLGMWAISVAVFYNVRVVQKDTARVRLFVVNLMMRICLCRRMHFGNLAVLD